ncbi:MAG TPA: DUF1080 domain-containing protein [Bryobacteraceae bacterium]|nr:DUF1080 domain-containing protein [Bryobacteraceae bacterium]
MLKTLTCALALAAVACMAQPNHLTSQEKSAGWQLLFDGKTLSGWDDPARKSPPGNSFTVEDGCIKVTAKPRIQEELLSTASFGDFELLFDWCISPRGNSGVKYRIQRQVFLRQDKVKRFEDLVDLSVKNPAPRSKNGQDYVIAFEYQVIDNRANPDALRGAKQQAGALYNLVAPASDASRPPGEWNQGRILLRGNHVEHWLNGVKVVDAMLDAPDIAEGLARRWGAGSSVYQLLTTQPRRECPISLQNHNDDAWFRNIRIRRLR